MGRRRYVPFSSALRRTIDRYLYPRSVFLFLTNIFVIFIPDKYFYPQSIFLSAVDIFMHNRYFYPRSFYPRSIFLPRIGRFSPGLADLCYAGNRNGVNAVFVGLDRRFGIEIALFWSQAELAFQSLLPSDLPAAIRAQKSQQS